MKPAILCIMSLFSSLVVTAQLPSDFRTEQIYINPDRHVYLPGDTIGVEGIVRCFAADQVLPYSNYLNIELFDQQDSILVRQKISCKDKGSFSTKVPIEYDCQLGVYYLRAYTELMRNFSLECFPIQPLIIGKAFPKHEQIPTKVSCKAIVGGKTLVAGFPQSVTIELRDDSTFPICEDVFILNSKGDTVTYGRTSTSGITQLLFIPELSQQYCVAGDICGLKFIQELPAPTQAIKLQGSLNGKRISYQLLNGETNRADYLLCTFDRINGLVTVDDVKTSGILILENAPRLVTLFLTDKSHNIISECTVSAKYEMTASLQAADTLRLGEEIKYYLHGAKEGCTVMARIVPENDLLVHHGESDLVYLSDFSSPLPFPIMMFDEGNEQRGRDLQAWLATASFKRFNIKEAIEKGESIYAFQPEQVMHFSGWIEQKNKRPMHGGTLIAYHTKKDFVYDTGIDSNGQFCIAVDDFAEGEGFYLQALNTKGKSDFVNYHLDDETFPAILNHSKWQLPRNRYADTETSFGRFDSSNYTVGRDSIRNYRLPSISIKAKLREEEPPKDTPQFYNTNYVDRETIEKRNFQTLFEILQDMPGVIATYDDNFSNELGGQSRAEDGSDPNRSLRLTNTRGASVLHKQNNDLPVIIDGDRYGQAEYGYVFTIPATQIESVELLRPWQTNAYISGAVNGAILVKTRDYKERPNLVSKGAMYFPTGLSKLQGTFQGVLSPPNEKGTYRLAVDMIWDKGVESFDHIFVVE